MLNETGVDANYHFSLTEELSSPSDLSRIAISVIRQRRLSDPKGIPFPISERHNSIDPPANIQGFSKDIIG